MDPELLPGSGSGSSFEFSDFRKIYTVPEFRVPEDIYSVVDPE